MKNTRKKSRSIKFVKINIQQLTQNGSYSVLWKEKK